MAKAKCNCPKPGLSAPFYMLTYGDLMTLLLTFFVLLFAMSSTNKIKFQASMGILQGSMGISDLNQHAPMQQNLPSPSLKQSPRIVSKSQIQPSSTQPLAQSAQVDSFDPAKEPEQEKLKALLAFGIDKDLQIEENQDGFTITLPTYELFNKGEYKVNPLSPRVQKLTPIYKELARQIGHFSQYHVTFTGHTDSLPLKAKPNQEGPKDNLELGFARAVNVFNYFFADQLADKTRVTFSSQGDHVPVITGATLDSEHRQNRRIEITLKKMY